MKQSVIHFLVQVLCDLALAYGAVVLWSSAAGNAEYPDSALLWIPVVRFLNGDYFLRFAGAAVLKPWISNRATARYVAVTSLTSILMAEVYWFVTGQVRYEPLFGQTLPWVLLGAFAISAAVASSFVARMEGLTHKSETA